MRSTATTPDTEIIARMMRNEADMAYRRRVQTICEWLAPQDGDHILDGGCGRGYYLKFIRHLCRAKLVGVELVLPYAQIAKTALAGETDVNLVNGSLDDLPFPDGIFNKAILSEVLEHVDDEVKILQSVARVLKPGGLLAITVPNANYPFWWDPINRTLETLLQTHIQHGLLAGIWASHVRLYTPDRLRTAVLAAGMEIANERSFTHYCFPFMHNIVYGFGKTVFEAGLLPKYIAAAADRHKVNGDRGGKLNPVNIVLSLFERFDQGNIDNEPPGRATVNLCILARKPE